jgi:AcrR family transcriptional regulator
MPKVVPEYREQAKRRIIAAADAEFARKGFRETTMSDIAEKIGVSKGAVYQYFETKEALIGAVGDAFLERFIENEFLTARRAGLIETTEGAMERMLKSMPSWFPNLICDFLSEAHRDPKAKLLVREIDQKLVKAISGFWEDRRKAGEVPPDVDTEKIARGLVALQLGLMAFVSTGLPRSEAIDAWTEMVKGLGNGLEPGKR